MDKPMRDLIEAKERHRQAELKAVARGELTLEELKRRRSLFADAPMTGVLERLRKSGQTL